MREANEQIIELWSDTVGSFAVFDTMLTQWNYAGIDGRGNLIRSGMRYESLGEVWQRLAVPESDRDDVFADLRVMEAEALRTMRLAREKQQG